MFITPYRIVSAPTLRIERALGILTLSLALVAQASDPAPDHAAPSSGIGTEPLFEARIILREADLDKRLQRLSELAAQLSLPEIPRALLAAEKVNELRERMVFERAVLVRWGELAPEEAFAHISRLPESRLKVETLRAATVHLVDHNPELAAAAIETLSQGASRNEVISLAAHLWSQKNVAAALDWGRRLPDGWVKESALEAIRYTWVHADPVGASNHVAQLGPSRTTDNLVINVAFGWARFDPDAAIQWVSDLPLERNRHEALISIAESWANHDPEAAVDFALKLPEPTLRTRAAAAAAMPWARQNPTTVLEWVLQQEDLELRTRAAAAVLEVWGPVDPVRSGQWVENLEPGPERDSIVAAYVDFAVTWAPEIATCLARTIGDERTRARVLDRSVNRWLEIDPSAARRWLEGADLPRAMTADWLGGHGQATGEVELNPREKWRKLMSSATKARNTHALTDAETLAVEALDIALKSDPLDTLAANSFWLLGDIYLRQERFVLAEESLLNAVSSMEEAVGSNHREMIPVLDHLADFYKQREQYERVIPVYHRILMLVDRDPLPDEYSAIAERSRNLAEIHRLLGQHAQAVSYENRASRLIEASRTWPSENASPGQNQE